MKLVLVLLALFALGCSSIFTWMVHPLIVGEIELDPSTLHTVGLSLPVLAGDEDDDAAVYVKYREIGTDQWKEALPLQRVLPDTLSHTVPTPFPIARQFAGSIFDLKSDCPYEIRLSIEDPDGGSTTRTTTVRTRAMPRDLPHSPRVVLVDTNEALSSALAGANPGDVITLGEGRFSGPFQLTRSGTRTDPIVIRGRSRQETAIEAPGAQYGFEITGSHVHLEDMTIRSSAWGISIADTSDVVVRRMRITDVYYGINGRRGDNRNFYICDNELDGKGVRWPDTSRRTWNYEGIVVTGAGHVICHNTLAGFGDALGLSEPAAIPNRGIDFYGNDVLWGGDDGIELDYSERNVRAYRNRFGNVAMGVSFQPVWGGPVYAHHNLIYNTAVAPYKLNQNPSGLHILHNTSIRHGWAWLQYGNYVSNMTFVNNVTIGTDRAVYVIPYLDMAGIDYNGWSPDGEFKFDYSWSGFSALSHQSPYEHHGRLLSTPVFVTKVVLPSSFEAFMPPPVLNLNARSNAVDAGLPLPNINDDYAGERPDLGALERGREPPQYGVRWRMN